MQLSNGKITVTVETDVPALQGGVFVIRYRRGGFCSYDPIISPVFWEGVLTYARFQQEGDIMLHTNNVKRASLAREPISSGRHFFLTAMSLLVKAVLVQVCVNVWLVSFHAAYLRVSEAVL